MGCHTCINAKSELIKRGENSSIKGPHPLLIIITFSALIVIWGWFPPAGLAQHKVKNTQAVAGGLPAVLPEAREWGKGRILRTLPGSARALAWCWTNGGEDAGRWAQLETMHTHKDKMLQHHSNKPERDMGKKTIHSCRQTLPFSTGFLGLFKSFRHLKKKS